MLQLEMREKELIKYVPRPLSALVDVVYPSAEMLLLLRTGRCLIHSPNISWVCGGGRLYSPWSWGGFQLSGVAPELVLGEHALTATCHFTLLSCSEKGGISWRAGCCWVGAYCPLGKWGGLGYSWEWQESPGVLTNTAATEISRISTIVLCLSWGVPWRGKSVSELIYELKNKMKSD